MCIRDSVNADDAAVQADIIILGNAPLAARIVLVVHLALAVFLFQAFFRHTVPLAVEADNSVGAKPGIRIDEGMKAVLPIAQYIGGTAPNDNARLFFCKVRYDVVLNGIKLVRKDVYKRQHLTYDT